MNYYRCADNLHKIKRIINYTLRWALYHTLANKHKCTIKQLVNKYGPELQNEESTKGCFPTKVEIASMRKKFMINQKLREPYSALSQWTNRKDSRTSSVLASPNKEKKHVRA